MQFVIGLLLFLSKNTPMHTNSNKKYWILILSALFSFLALFIYLIHVLSPNKEFASTEYVRDITISFCFMVLIALVDYKLVLKINNTKWLRENLIIRVVFEVSALSLLAVIFVIVGNIPFQNVGSVWEYVSSIEYKEAAIASILLNVFTITVIEFFIQNERTIKLQSENAKMQYQQLKSQINPHFLFNSLNVLVSLINKDKDKATDYTQKLSLIYRYVLSHDMQDTILVRDELEFIRNYTEILKIRFGDGLQVSYNLKDEDLNKEVPPMSLQVLFENAVKHNALTQSNPLSVCVSSDTKYLIISNNIIPRMRVASSLGIGLNNLNKKYLLISKKNISVKKKIVNLLLDCRCYERLDS